MLSSAELTSQASFLALQAAADECWSVADISYVNLFMLIVCPTDRTIQLLLQTKGKTREVLYLLYSLRYSTEELCNSRSSSSSYTNDSIDFYVYLTYISFKIWNNKDRLPCEDLFMTEEM